MSDVRETVVVPDPSYRAEFHPRRSNNSRFGSKAGIAALSALTGGVLTWAALAHGGLGTTATPAATPPAVEPGSAFHDGTFTGAGFEASGGDIIVHVTVANGVITDITADYPTEPAMSGDINRQYIPQLIDSAIAAQNADITNITGATVTSDAFKGSLQDALNQASGGAGGGVVAAVPPVATVEPTTPAATPSPLEPAHVGDLHNGTFYGEGFESGPGGNTYVTMSVVNGHIFDIRATWPTGNETSAGISADAVPQLVDQAIEKQSADIDVVTGATNTSNAFIQSLQDAINQSKAGYPVDQALPLHDGTFTGAPLKSGPGGDTVVTMTVLDGRIAAVTGVFPIGNETSRDISAGVIKQLAPEAKEVQGANLSLITGGTHTSEAFIGSLQDAINQSRSGAPVAPETGELTDGTYTGNPALTGPGGDAVVEIVVSGGRITEISVPQHPDNDYNATSIPQLIDEAKEAQSAHINIVTGATGTSNAFIASLQNAINQARS